MNDLLSDEVVSQIVGVIDLLRGRAVHAIAGDRDDYRPVAICGGDPQTLADQYRNLGAADLYVADLDSITGGDIQVATIDAICRAAAEGAALIDVGWTGEEDEQACDTVANLAATHSNTHWIAATESTRSVDALAKLAELVSPDRVLLGLDYRGGKLLGAAADEETWVHLAIKVGCGGAVILDLASVGTSGGPSTIDICDRVKRLAPTLPLYSGGGIRTAQDVRSLNQAGCDRCLVATLLHECCGGSKVV